MVLHSELHVNWVADAIGYLDAQGAQAIEARCGSCRRMGGRMQPTCRRNAYAAGQFMVSRCEHPG